MKARFIKTILFSALSAMAAFSAVTYSSCSPDKCKAIVCAYGGVCNNGACICQTGYEGTRCEVVTRDKYLGLWAVIEQGTITDPAHYSTTISPDSTSNSVADVVIGNFYNSLTKPLKATVNGDTLYISNQTIDNKMISGLGVITTPNTIYGQRAQLAMYYTVTDKTNGKTNVFGVDSNGSPSIWTK